MNIFSILAIIFFALTAISLVGIFSPAFAEELISERILKRIQVASFITEPICGIAFLVFGYLSF